MFDFLSKMGNFFRLWSVSACKGKSGRFCLAWRGLMIAFVIPFVAVSCEMADTGFGSVQGRVVRMSSGDPIPGVRVVYGDSAVLTDENGEYLYENVPEHRQTLRFDVDGYAPVYQQVNVVRNKTVSCDVGMQLIVAGWAVGKIDSEYGTILHSVDGGRNWIRRGSQSTVPSVELTDVCALGEDICWIVGEKDDFAGTTVILKTTDGGLSWVNEGRNVSGVPPVSLSAIFSKKADTALAVAADTCLILNTRNAGRSWSVCNESADMKYYTAITSPDGYRIWCAGQAVGGGAAVEYSPDGGRTWACFPVTGLSSNQKITDICAVDSLNLYVTVSAMGGVLHSQDAGATWTAVSKVVPTADFAALDVFDRDNIRILQNGGMLYLTSDSFETVQMINAAGSEYASGAATSIGFLRDGLSGAFSVLSPTGATGALYYTLDGGMSWQKSVTPFDFAVNSLDFVGGMN